jgi:cobalt/nickel transport system permease protein
MRHDFLDRYSRLDSPIHRLPAGFKLALSLVLTVVVVTTAIDHALFFGGVTILLVVVAVMSRIPPLFLVRRLALLEPVVLGVAVLSLIEPGGTRIFASILTKSTLCLFTMILLSNTTAFSDILAVLRCVRMPALLVTVLALMYRYLFVLIDEAERMQRARRSRSFTHTRVRLWRSLGAIIGQLFIRSSERAERIYAAMCARGWQ